MYILIYSDKDKKKNVSMFQKKKKKKKNTKKIYNTKKKLNSVCGSISFKILHIK